VEVKTETPAAANGSVPTGSGEGAKTTGGGGDESGNESASESQLSDEDADRSADEDDEGKSDRKVRIIPKVYLKRK